MDANIQLEQTKNKTELSLVKSLFLFLLCFCFVSLFWISLKEFSLSEVFFLTDLKISLLKFVFLSLWLALFLSCFVILILTIEQRFKLVFLNLFLTLPIIIFLHPFKILDTLTISIFFIGSLFYSFILKSISKNYIYFIPSHILPKPLGLFLLFLTLSISLNSYIKIQTSNTNFIQPLAKKISSSATNYIFGNNMKITETTTLHEAAMNLAKNISSGNQTLPMTDILIQQNMTEIQTISQDIITQQIEQNILNFLGQTNQIPQKTNLLLLFENYLDNSLRPFTFLLPYLIALLVFFTIRFLNPFWLYSTILITKLSLEFLKYLGIIKVIQIQQPVERLQIL